MQNFVLRVGTSLAISLAIAACGGGDARIASVPPPTTGTPGIPSPSPSPPPPPADPEGPIGLVSSQPFAVLGAGSDYKAAGSETWTASGPDRADISFSYRTSDGVYTITLPDLDPGDLETQRYSGSYIDSTAWQSVAGSVNGVLDGASGRQDAMVFLSWPSGELNDRHQYSYTSWGSWSDDYNINGTATAGTQGNFAYGIPTAQADVPTTGSASYKALLIGTTGTPYAGSSPYFDSITGSAALRFDFGAGTLTGEMRPEICPWDCESLGVYAFVETVFSQGSTSFSGRFAKDGETLPSWFEGLFTGPQAAELMARWQAPYTYGSTTGTMGGIWIGKKD